MSFLRYQEFYESPNPKFRNNSFTILEYIEWYSNKYGDGAFTYPNDWSGFNLPSKAIELARAFGILDPNKYDNEINLIYSKIREYESGDFYIIGTTKKDTETLEHEIAHALWSTDVDYKKDMTKNISSLGNKTVKKLKLILANMGYNNSVMEDEIQAYLSTGLVEELEELKIKPNYINRFASTYFAYRPTALPQEIYRGN